MANHNFIYQNMTEALPAVLRAVMDGEEVGARGGTRCRELIATSITLTKPWRREILTPGRRCSLPAQVFESMWILTGRNDIDSLSNYLPRAEQFSDDGKVWRGGYGPRLRNFRGIDQVAHVVRLLQEDPTTRRAVIAIYDPVIDSADGKDIPCNDLLQFTSRLGKLDCHVYIRSNDAIWGLSGVNSFEWSALQEIIAGILGVQVGSLHLHQGSLHTYSTHWERAEALAEAAPAPVFKDSPRFDLGTWSLATWDVWAAEWFRLERQIRLGRWNHYAVRSFPEPLMRSWLQVLEWHWTGDERFLEPLKGTNLYAAALASPTPSRVV